MLSLCCLCPPFLQAWERVVQLQFGERPGDPPLYSLYCEVMSRYVIPPILLHCCEDVQSCLK